MRLVDHPEPSISSPRELKLRMLEVGVCGTDRELCAFRFGSAPQGSDHYILGHESLAEVVDIGDDVAAYGPATSWWPAYASRAMRRPACRVARAARISAPPAATASEAFKACTGS